RRLCAGELPRSRPLPGGPSLLVEDEVKCPATANVGAWRTQVREDISFGAAGLFESVGEDSEAGSVQVAAGKLTVVVGGLGEALRCVRKGAWCDADQAERVSEHLAHEGCLGGPLGEKGTARRAPGRTVHSRWHLPGRCVGGVLQTAASRN